MNAKKVHIPLMVPDIREEDILEVEKVLRSGMLVQGERVRELEDQFAEYVGTKYAVAVSNGTASLHIALKAHGIGTGDEVIVPAFSYIATANVVELVGATPVFVDIDLRSYNIDVDQIESKITKKTKAIIPVHEFGLACEISKVIQIAKKYELVVIEDAACGLGTTFNNQHVGSFGDVGSFSFHPRKAITGGEGGMLVTNNSNLAKKFRTLRNHGISPIDGKNQFVDAGFNYRLTDIQAALIYSQFKRIDQIMIIKQKIADEYLLQLSNELIFELPIFSDNKQHSWQSFHILLDDKICRDTVIIELRKRGVYTNLGAQCIPNENYYKKRYQIDCDKMYPNAILANRSGLVLPIYEKLTFSDIKTISRIIKEYFCERVN